MNRGVASGQRFNARRPCPICGGHDRLPRGKGERCFGFMSADGEYAHCSRAELAGRLRVHDPTQTYAHRLAGKCACGKEHGPTGEAPVARAPAPRRRQVAVYDYRNGRGKVLFQTVRYEPKGFVQRRPYGKGGHVWNLRGVKLVPFNLPELLAAEPADPVFIVEGEKDALALHGLGLVATTNPMGAGKWRLVAGVARKVLAGRDVVVIPDRDEPGRKHATEVAASLRGVARSLRVLELPPPAKDVSDWIAAGGDVPRLRDLVGRTREWQPPQNEPDPDRADESDTGEDRQAGGENDAKPSQATLVVRLLDGAELFHSPDGRAWACVPVAGHRETYPLSSPAFRVWLARRFYEAEGAAPSAQTLLSGIAVLEGQARFDCPETSVHTRVAAHGEAVYLDLCDPEWRAIEITARGWRVVTTPPVRFRRARGMMPLPEPERGDSMSALRGLLNLASDRDWVLLQAWLVGSLRPAGPFPLLALHGEQGSAKSTTARIVRALIDPNAAPLRAEPRDARDLIIAASNSWVVGLDNLSHVPEWLSDALCRLATGGGFGTRELFSDEDEILFEAKRPMVINGIEELATRPDLLDRALVLNLPAIQEDDRKPESRLWSQFERVRAGVLGAILDAVVWAVRGLPTVKLERLPRMADFALWGTAAEQGLGLEPGEFMAAYMSNRQAANDLALEGSLLSGPLREIAASGEWIGTAADLLSLVTGRVDEQTRSQRSWPRNARSLSCALRRLASNLRAAGVGLDLDRREPGGIRRRLIRIFAATANGETAPGPAGSDGRGS